MQEGIPNSEILKRKKGINDLSGSFIRHSKSGYETYKSIRSSGEPLADFDQDQQILPDLTPEGVELANNEAENFFSTFSPEDTSLFFVSSNEARAIETADIYRHIAHSKGFEIIKPEHARSSLSEQTAEGEIRVLHNLSIYPNKSKVVFDGMFNPKKYRGQINWDKIPEDVRQKYDQAIAIIDADDQGSFVANFAKHAETIKEIIPEIDTPEELYNSKFKNLIRLAQFGEKKIKEGDSEKPIKILAFGHENYLIYFLQKYLEKENIGNCEVVNFSIEDGKVKIDDVEL